MIFVDFGGGPKFGDIWLLDEIGEIGYFWIYWRIFSQLIFWSSVSDWFSISTNFWWHFGHRFQTGFQFPFPISHQFPFWINQTKTPKYQIAQNYQFHQFHPKIKYKLKFHTFHTFYQFYQIHQFHQFD